MTDENSSNNNNVESSPSSAQQQQQEPQQQQHDNEESNVVRVRVAAAAAADDDDNDDDDESANTPSLQPKKDNDSSSPAAPADDNGRSGIRGGGGVGDEENNNDGDNASSDNNSNSKNMWIYYYAIPTVFILVSLVFRRPNTTTTTTSTTSSSSIFLDWIVWPFYQLLLTVIGITMGVALGLGLAAHVYDQLTEWHDRHHQQQQLLTDGSLRPTMPNSNSTNAPSFRRAVSSTTGTAAAANTATALQHADDYASLMASAGYPPPPVAGTAGTGDNNAKLVRGVVVRSDTAWLHQPNYGFALSQQQQQQLQPQHAIRLFQELWPAVPASITQKLGYFVELILRDFVACWYCSVDEGCEYRDAKQVLLEQQQKKQQQQSQTQTTTAAATASQQQHSRVMLYSLARHRSSPFLDSLYESVVIMFGNLATRVEHVNVFAVVLLQWTRVLAHTFKVYRALRKSVLHKQRFLQAQQQQQTQTGVNDSNHMNTNSSNNVDNNRRRRGDDVTVSSMTASNLPRRHRSSNSNRADSTSRHGSVDDDNEDDRNGATTRTTTKTKTPVSEIAMTKEFLFAGKLHRAITFGLDVPGLLFADASGRECGTPDPLPDSVDDYETMTTPEDIALAKRLFETPLLRECELDYNRVVAHRMVRALVTRQDYGSPIVASLLTEIMAGCVLTPMMSVFTPEYLNSWVIKGLSTSEGEEEQVKNGDETTATGDNFANEGETSQDASATTTDPLLGSLDQMEREVAGTATPTNSHKKTNELVRESPEQRALEDLSENAALILSSSAEHSAVDAPSSPTAEDNIISLLALAVIDLSKYVDFEEYRIAREIRNQEFNVDWDDPGCRAAVLRLVLVIELALTHGRCTYKSKNLAPTSVDSAKYLGEFQDEEEEFDEIDESEQELEVTLSDYESTTLSQLLMEATSDPASFEERVATENTLAAEMNANKYEDMEWEEYKPTTTEQSTVRTLIAAWLHTGQIFRMVSVLSQAHATVLAPYFHENAFLRSRTCANGFVRQLRALEDVEILVDTMTVLACPRLDETDDDSLRELIKKATAASPTSRAVPREEALAAPNELSSPTSISAAQLMSSSSTPRYLDFHRNESFASSLRSERERRMQSWQSIISQEDGEAYIPVCRTKGVSQECIALHRELHHISRIFYTGTNIVGIRDAARRKNSGQTEGASIAEASTSSDEVHLSLLTVETACPRRRIEVPDDDSSFLLRAQVSTDTQSHFSSPCLLFSHGVFA